MRGSNRLAFFVALILGAVPAVATAGEATGVLRLSLTVLASCSVQTQPVTFASYITGGPATGTAVPGSVDVACTKGTPAAVYLDGNRVLTGPNGNQVAYSVQANGHAWPAGQAVNVVGQGTTNAIHLSISGSVAAGQQVAIGDYEAEQVVRVVY
jgi:spore coat protein U-like protein